jgi:hypothetical protein
VGYPPRRRRSPKISQPSSPSSRPPTKIPSISQIIQELLQLSPGLKGGGTRTTDVIDLYPVYLALVDKLSNEESKGDTPYVRLSPTDFHLLTIRRQLGEFCKLGIEAATDNAAWTTNKNFKFLGMGC